MKKIISFSLYGEHSKYSIGMLCNVELAKKIYPDWICRIYYGGSVPPQYIEKLSEYNNTELIQMDESENGIFPMIWRFLAIDDDVEVMIVRDADSRLSYREKSCVDIFMESDKLLHSIKDHSLHNDIMGGMWGIKKNNRIKIKEFINNGICKHYGCDERFLRSVIKPKFLDSHLEHCSYYLKNFPVENQTQYYIGGWWFEDNCGKPYDYIFF